MAFSFDGTNTLERASRPVSGFPQILSIWFYPTDTPWSTHGTIYQVHTGDWRYVWMRALTTGTLHLTRNDNSGAENCATTNTYTADAWNHALFIVYGTSSAIVVLNGDWANRGTNGGVVGASTWDQTNFGYGDRNSFPAEQPFIGHLAHAAHWNVALVQAEIEALAAGVDARTVRPASLTQFWPMYGNGSPAREFVANFTLTNVGSVAHVSEYPPIMRPRIKAWPIPSTFTGGSISADAAVLKTLSSSINANAALLNTILQSIAADAVVLNAVSQSIAADSSILNALSNSVSANAAILRTLLNSVTADSTVLNAVSDSIAVDATFLKVFLDSVTADATIFTTLSNSVTADASISVPGVFTIYADAVIQALVSGSISADAIVQGLISGSITANSVIQSLVSDSITADANIATPGVYSILADAVIQALITGSINANAAIEKLLTGSINANAAIQRYLSGTITVDALIGTIFQPRQSAVMLSSGVLMV